MAHYDHINSKKYICWTVPEFVQEMKDFSSKRTLDFVISLGVRSIERQFLQNLPPINISDAVRQIEAREDGEAYRMFLEFNTVGGDDFFQEIHTCLSFIDFLNPEDVESVCLPVKNNCPDGILLHLTEMHDYRETNSEYDFAIKKDGSYIKCQVKSAPERYISEFNSDYFVADIARQVARYNDPEMVLVYLLQPSINRTNGDTFYGMFETISKAIDAESKIKNVYFLVRPTLQLFDYIQVFPELKRFSVDLNSSLAFQVRQG